MLGILIQFFMKMHKLFYSSNIFKIVFCKKFVTPNFWIPNFNNKNAEVIRNILTGMTQTWMEELCMDIYLIEFVGITGRTSSNLY